MEDIRNKVEAVLFTTGKFLTVNEIAELCEIGSIGFVKEALEALKLEYEQRNGALEVLNEDNKWRMAIKKQYLYLTEKLLNAAEMDRPTQETLAVIAYKQPVFQSEVIKIRGNKAYDHIKSLVEQSFIVSEKSGRTRILKLTEKFYDYFDVVDDTLKAKFSETEKVDEEHVTEKE